MPTTLQRACVGACLCVAAGQAQLLGGRAAAGAGQGQLRGRHCEEGR